MLSRELNQSCLFEKELSDDQRRQVTFVVNRFCWLSGISTVIYRHIHRHLVARGSNSRRPLRVLSVPNPEIEFPLSWARRARKFGREIELTLAGAVDGEQQRSKMEAAIADGFSIKCIDYDGPGKPLPTGFDLVVSLHGMHSLDDNDAFRQLQSLQGSADGSMIVCDFYRSTVNLVLVKSAIRIFRCRPLTRQSIENQIRGAFAIEEFQRLAERALARPIKVERTLPCHFIMASTELAITELVPAFA